MTRTAKRSTVAAYASAAAYQLDRAMVAGSMSPDITLAELARIVVALRELRRLVRTLRRRK